MEANADFDPGAARSIGETLKANLRRALKVREEALRDMLVRWIFRHIRVTDRAIGDTVNQEAFA